jgi:outer membrane protein OmpA-like peptidoglycan-associated protein
MACATGAPKADFPAGSDPQAKLSEADARIVADRAKHVDVLSPSHFEQAEKSLRSAREKAENGKSSEDVLSETAQAVGHLQVAEANAAAHTAELQPVLTAREHALQAKAPTALPKLFKSADDDLRDFGQDIEKQKFSLNSKDASKLEGKYAELELAAIQQNNLGEARSLIENAKNEGAKSKTPQTLTEAQVQYDSAMRSIETNRRNPAAFEPAVAQSKKSAYKLDQVLRSVKDTGATEVAALQIYNQKQQLDATHAELAATDARAKQAQSTADSEAARAAALAGENKDYASKAAMNQKIEAIKGEFSPEEAEVVRDGSKIVIRLKSMKFSTARYELTTTSLDTLQKVKEMIAAVPVKQVVVEGHTDSVGGPAKNHELSQKRAEAIKKYFVAENAVPAEKIEAQGFGYEKPLATNKTKEGRATNRRVDVVIDTTVTQ